jgi:hypothetical protein
MIKNLKYEVEDILKTVPESRNSDITLMIEIWKKYYPRYLKQASNGKDVGIYLKDLYELPREDSVKRIRAKFNVEGYYWPTEWNIAKNRRINENEWRKHLGYSPRLI